MKTNAIGFKIKNLIENSKYTVAQVADLMGMTNQNLYKILKKDSVDSKIIIELSKLFGVSVNYFFDDKPLEKFGTGMAKAKDEGGGLKGMFGAISKNLPQATEWLERAESLSHENEELKAMVDSQQQTIQAHEATIEALKENITLLKESREQATGRVKHVVRSGEGEA